MANFIKKGIGYFPFDVDAFQDVKIRKLIKCQGGKAVTVYVLLLCTIYRDGYYTRWDAELPFMIAEQSGFEAAYVREAVKSCLALGLLDKGLFDREGVLTSEGIQTRYLKVCKESKVDAKLDEFSLVEAPEARKVGKSMEEKEAELDARRRKFFDSLVPFVQQYGRAMVRAFYDYWTEANKSKTQMRFEQQRTWETNLRLATWAKRDKSHGDKNKANITDYDNNRKYEDF